MFCGPSSRAIDCASARTACLPPANAEKPRPPRRLAVSPVNSMGAATARHHGLGRFARRQETGEGGHLPDLAVDAAVVSRISKRTLPPMLKTKTSMSPISVFDLAEQFHDLFLVARVRAERWTLPPSRVISATRCFSLSALRRVATAVQPSRAKRRAIAPPAASPAPITTQTLLPAMGGLLAVNLSTARRPPREITS